MLHSKGLQYGLSIYHAVFIDSQLHDGDEHSMDNLRQDHRSTILADIENLNRELEQLFASLKGQTCENKDQGNITQEPSIVFGGK